MYWRAIIVLAFCSAIAAMLMTFPGRFFVGTSGSERNPVDNFGDAQPMDSDDPQTIGLRADARSAMNELVTRQPQKAKAISQENGSSTPAAKASNH